MPRLRKNDVHNCPFCDYPSSRCHMKTHLTKAKNDGKPRCSGLNKVLPNDVWDQDILPHYTSDAKFPELSEYIKVKNEKKRKLTPLKKLTPGSRHITRRLKNVLQLIEDEASHYRVMYGDGDHEDYTFDEVIERRNMYIIFKNKSKESPVIKKKRPSTHRHKAKKLSKLSK